MMRFTSSFKSCQCSWKGKTRQSHVLPTGIKYQSLHTQSSFFQSAFKNQKSKKMNLKNKNYITGKTLNIRDSQQQLFSTETENTSTKDIEELFPENDSIKEFNRFVSSKQPKNTHKPIEEKQKENKDLDSKNEELFSKFKQYLSETQTGEDLEYPLFRPFIEYFKENGNPRFLGQCIVEAKQSGVDIVKTGSMSSGFEVIRLTSKTPYDDASKLSSYLSMRGINYLSDASSFGIYLAIVRKAERFEEGQEMIEALIEHRGAAILQERGVLPRILIWAKQAGDFDQGMKYYHMFLQGGGKPSQYVYSALMAMCSIHARYIPKALEIMNEVDASGMTVDVVVIGSLLKALSSSDSNMVKPMMEILNKVKPENLNSKLLTNAMRACFRMNDGHNGFNVFRQFINAGVVPSFWHFSALALLIQTKAQFEFLVEEYVKFLREAHNNPFSSKAKIREGEERFFFSAITQIGRSMEREEMYNAFVHLREKGISANAQAYERALSFYRDPPNFDVCQHYIKMAEEDSIELNSLSYAYLVQIAVDDQRPQEAQRLFDEMLRHPSEHISPLAIEVLFQAVPKLGDAYAAKVYNIAMDRSPQDFNEAQFAVFVKACLERKTRASAQKAMEVYKGLQNEHRLRTAAISDLLELLLMNNMNEDALHVFADAVEYNMAIRKRTQRRLRSSLGQKPLEALLDWKLSSESKSYALFNQIFSCFGACLGERVFDILKHMEEIGIQPTIHTFRAALEGCRASKEPERAMQVLKEMESRGFNLRSSDYLTIIETCDHHHLETAFQLFQDLLSRELQPLPSVFNHLIQILGESKDKRVFILFDMMRQYGYYPNRNAVSCLSEIAALNRDQDRLVEISQLPQVSGAPLTIPVYESLVKGWMKMGEVDKAIQVFEQLSHLNSGQAGRVALPITQQLVKWRDPRIFEIFDGIQKTGKQAPRELFSQLLTVCHDTGDFDRAVNIVGYMRNSDIEPTPQELKLLTTV